MRKQKRSKTAIPGPDSNVADRVIWLLENYWNDNQAEMSRALKFSPAAISRVVTGQQKPGRGFLEALARHRDVNDEWVLSGKGGLFHTAPAAQDESGYSVPVAGSLLPGAPSLHRQLLTRFRASVVESDWAVSRYVIQADRQMSEAARDRAYDLKVDDLLLLETDLAAWAASRQTLAGRLCAFQVGPYPGIDPTLTLGKVADNFDGGETNDVQLFGRGIVQGVSLRLLGPRTPPPHRRLRGIDFDDEPPPAPETRLPIKSALIVAVAILLQRTL